MKWHYLVEYLRLLLFATRTVVDIIIRDILFRQNHMKRLRKTRKITNFDKVVTGRSNNFDTTVFTYKTYSSESLRSTETRFIMVKFSTTKQDVKG